MQTFKVKSGMHRDTQHMNWNSGMYFCLELLTMWVYAVIGANTERQDKNLIPR